MTYIVQAKNGRLKHSSDYNRARLNEDIRLNEGARYRIERETPESKDQRGFLHGAVYPLWAYLDGNNFKDNEVINHYHHKAKIEFNGGMLIRNGKPELYGKSTKGVLNNFTNKVVDYLEEHYAVDREEVLDTKAYKHWRDAIYPAGGPETYIEYMVEIGNL